MRGKDCQLKALIDQTLYNKAFRRKAESLCNNAYALRYHAGYHGKRYRVERTDGRLSRGLNKVALVKRDAIFYQIFQRFPSLLFTLLEHPPQQARGYRFESIEVKEPTFRIDGVFVPPEEASPKVVYFAEFQFQPDELLYHRFFSYQVRLNTVNKNG